MSGIGVNDPQAAAQVSGCLRELFKLIKNTDEARRGGEPTLNSISGSHRKIQSDQKLSPAMKARLKSLYEDAAKDASKVSPRTFLLISHCISYRLFCTILIVRGLIESFEMGPHLISPHSKEN